MLSIQGVQRICGRLPLIFPLFQLFRLVLETRAAINNTGGLNSKSRMKIPDCSLSKLSQREKQPTLIKFTLGKILHVTLQGASQAIMPSTLYLYHVMLPSFKTFIYPLCAVHKSITFWPIEGVIIKILMSFYHFLEH